MLSDHDGGRGHPVPDLFWALPQRPGVAAPPVGRRIKSKSYLSFLTLATVAHSAKIDAISDGLSGLWCWPGRSCPVEVFTP